MKYGFKKMVGVLTFSFCSSVLIRLTKSSVVVGGGGLLDTY